MVDQEMLTIGFNIQEPLQSRFENPLIIVSLIIQGARNSVSKEFDENLYSLARNAVEGISLKEVKNDPILRAYRDFYWKVCKIDPTKIRPSAEALIRRVLREKPLPNISQIVNAYNVASIESRISIGAYDVNSLVPPLMVRNAYDNEKFLGIGMSEPKLLSSDMLILSDAEQPINILPYRDADHSKITPATTDILLIGTGVWGMKEEEVLAGIERAAELIIQYCGGKRLGPKVNIWNT